MLKNRRLDSLYNTDNLGDDPDYKFLKSTKSFYYNKMIKKVSLLYQPRINFYNL